MVSAPFSSARMIPVSSAAGRSSSTLRWICRQLTSDNKMNGLLCLIHINIITFFRYVPNGRIWPCSRYYTSRFSVLQVPDFRFPVSIKSCLSGNRAEGSRIFWKKVG